VRFGTGLANLMLGTVAPSFWIQAPLWAALSTGAVIGGFLQMRYGEDAFLFPAAVSGILALIALVLTIAKPGSRYVSGEVETHPPDGTAAAKI
jgi:uncharacterized membrane protein YoaK (UPF0700 family)